jgi:predicted amidohydrolase YtcJ
LFIDVFALPFIPDLDKILAAYPAGSWMAYDKPLQLGGCKITIEHSPQGKTVSFTTPYLTVDRRTVLVHSQFVRRDQLDKYLAYAFIPSFCTDRIFLAAAHIANHGLEQASYISPMRDAIDLGLKPTNHTYFNVVPIDQMLVLRSAVNRLDRNGEVIGADQRNTPQKALQAITINATYQAFEEDNKGSIEVGKLADLVVLDANPLRVDPEIIKGISI